jgi:tetratricopeptide (TPR) repeat protein
MIGKEKLWTWLVCVGLAVGTALLYAPVLHYQFICFDDVEYIVNNYHIRLFNRECLAWCWQTTYASNWHPLTWMSHALDFKWFGMWAGGHHAASVVFHILNSLLLFVILRRMTGALWRSAIVAALFAWHPLHVESVAWVAERKDVLSTFFWMLSIWAYIRYTEEWKSQNARRRVFYALALLFFALGLTAKPMLVTLPFVLLLLDWWPLRRMQPVPPDLNPTLNPKDIDGSTSAVAKAIADRESHPAVIENPQSAMGSRTSTNPQSSGSRPAGSSAGISRLLIEKAPFLFLSAVSCVVTIYAQHQAAAIQTLENLPIPMRVCNSLIAYFQYVAKLIWPENLSVIYFLSNRLSPSETAAAGLFLAAVTAVAARLRRTRPYFLVGWLFFLGTLVPVIGLVQVGSQALADRYSYIPSIGFFIILCWGAYDIGLALRCRPVVLGITAGLALCSCALAAARQIGYWENSETLFRHAIAIDPENPIAHANYAAWLCDSLKLEQAAVECTNTLRLLPIDAMAHHTLGKVRFLQANYDAAIPELNASLRLDPQDYLPHLLLGRIALMRHEHEEAAGQASIVLARDSINPEAHCILGEALGGEGKFDEACAQFNEVLRRIPQYPAAHLELAIFLAKQGKADEAISHYRIAKNVPPAAPDSTVLNNLAWALATNPSPEFRSGAEAVKMAVRACELEHNQQPMFIGTLAAAYAEAGRFDDAVAAAQQAHDLALERAAKAQQPADAKAANDLAARNLELLAIYQSRQPYHEK